MDKEQYMQVQQQVVMLANMVRALPLALFIETAAKAETVGPFLDPTLYREAAGKLALIMGLARALQRFQVEANKLLSQEALKCSSPEQG
ncbi:MAG: hypothetical protein V2A77_05090 [Pseudomonadota bacterium]